MSVAESAASGLAAEEYTVAQIPSEHIGCSASESQDAEAPAGLDIEAGELYILQYDVQHEPTSSPSRGGVCPTMGNDTEHKHAGSQYVGSIGARTSSN